MIIFKVENISNGKNYIGYAINDNPNNLGSGKYIKRAVKKFKSDNPKFGYNESVQEMIPQKKKLTKKLQVLLTPEDEDNLNTIIIQKSMETGIKPIPISRYVRNIIVEHIVEETSPEKQLIKTK
jgi:hypothetical protein